MCYSIFPLFQGSLFPRVSLTAITKENSTQMFLRKTEINMKPTLMPSPNCATEQNFFSPHQDFQKQKVLAGIIIFVNVPTVDTNP